VCEFLIIIGKSKSLLHGLTSSDLVINNHTLRNTYVATLPCNMSLMACFADINVSQGSVATCARCDEIFNIHLTANLLQESSSEENC